MKRSSILRYKIFAPAVAVLGLLTTVLTPLPSAFADPTPSITSITPDHGTTAGGTHVTILGDGFHTSGSPSQVTIGGVAATNVVVVDHNTITAHTPAGAVGPALVVVINQTPQYKASDDQVFFTYGTFYTVTFNANGGSGSMSPQTAAVPTALTLNAFTNTGYGFTGWNTAANGSGTAYADGATYSFAADITLYAQWLQGAHTVTFDANGGTGSMSPQIAAVPTALTLNAFANTGYTFNGWNTAANGSGTGYANGATYSFLADVTLYAQWQLIPSHTVTFNANGGTGSMSPQTANVPTALTLNAFANTGYTFGSWNTAANGSGTAYGDGAIYSFAADITLYAQWVLGGHTVTFNANGGSGVMSPQVANTPTALTANAFTRSGYAFTGWNTNSEGGGTAYADGATYSFVIDVTLYAQWAVVTTHAVTFNANGGSGSMSNQVASVPTALTANAFTRSGYTFANWNMAANGSGTAYANGATYSFVADITLYAQWTLVTAHSVTFVANGGSGSMSVQTSSVPAALTSNAFTLSGYNFAGWNTIATGGGGAYANGATYSFAADMILYAQWTLVVAPVYVPPVTVTPAPPQAPPAPIAQEPLVLHSSAVSIPIPAFAAISTTGGSGSGVVTYSTSTPTDCAVDAVHGLVTGIIAGICTVMATKAADGTYLQQVSAPLDLTFFNIPVAAEPPAASPGLPATGLLSVFRTVTISGKALSKVIKVNLGASFAGKKATVQVRNARTTTYRTVGVVTLNKAGMAKLTRLVLKGSAIRVLVGGRSLAATIAG